MSEECGVRSVECGVWSEECGASPVGTTEFRQAMKRSEIPA